MYKKYIVTLYERTSASTLTRDIFFILCYIHTITYENIYRVVDNAKIPSDLICENNIL